MFDTILLKVLITAYEDNCHLTFKEGSTGSFRHFARKIERTISLLEGRWRKLRFLDHFDLELKASIIIAACVLRNFGYSTMILMMASSLMGIMRIMMLNSNTQMLKLNREEPI